MKLAICLHCWAGLWLAIVLLAGCSEPADSDMATDQRWYTAEQVAAGASVFQANCAECHGESAQGLVNDWRQTLADGSFPPPPLNGTAHAWHHPRSVLLQVIDNGGAEFGGKMPGFATVLDADEKLAVIAFFQDFWNDEIYSQWIQMGGTH